MPLISTTEGMAHEDARFHEMNVSQLRVRISRIRNPQKMFECVRCLLNHASSAEISDRRKVGIIFNRANDKLHRMGFNRDGQEVDENRARESMRGWNARGRPRTVRGRWVAEIPVSPVMATRLMPVVVEDWEGIYLRHRRNIRFDNGLINSEPSQDREPREFLNVLLSADVKPRIIAMALGITVEQLWASLKHYGCADDRQIRDMKDENDNILVKPQVRKISMRRENE